MRIHLGIVAHPTGLGILSRGNLVCFFSHVDGRIAHHDSFIRPERLGPANGQHRHGQLLAGDRLAVVVDVGRDAEELANAERMAPGRA